MAPKSFPSSHANPEESSPAWQFINIEKPVERQDKGTRYIVRQHVMRGVYQKKRQSKNRAVHPRKILCRDEVSYQEEDATSHSAQSVFDCTRCSFGNAKYFNGLRSRISEKNKTHNPIFSTPRSVQEFTTIEKYLPACITYPVDPKPYMHELVNHFFVYLGPILLDTDDFSKCWLRSRILDSLSDEMRFHGLLFAASAHRDTLRQSGISLITMAHRGKLLRMVNEDLSSSERGPAGTSIEAVLKLANFEEVLNELPSSQLHRHALHQMVKARGGLARVGDIDIQLVNMILLSDMMCAALNTSRPLFLKPHVWQSPCYPGSSITFPIRPHLDIDDRHEVIQASGLSATLMDILYEIQATTALLQFFNDHRVNPSVPTISSRRLPNRVRILTTLLTPAVLNCRSSVLNTTASLEIDFVIETIRLACLIYWDAITTLTPFTSPVYTPHVINLKIAMQRTNVHISWAPLPETLIWACLVGAAAAGTRPERGWFIAVLGPVIMAFCATSMKQAQASLLVFGWVVRMCAGNSERFLKLGTIVDDEAAKDEVNEIDEGDGEVADEAGWNTSIVSVRLRD